MSTGSIRNQLHQYLDQVDESYLDVLKVILEDRLRIQLNEKYFFTEEEIEELQRREQKRISGESSTDSVENVISRLQNQFGQFKVND
ncbi:MAG: hypothetical protein ACK5Z2_19690 [Bacteroidota bacterium]|jgi:hypothetical protein